MGKILAQDYKIEVMKAPEDEGGYLATIPQLGCWGDGCSMEEAMKDVIDVGNDLIELAIKDGVKLPVPQTNKEEEYSGKLTLRLPKYLHAEVAKAAEKEDCSINQLIQSYIGIGIGKAYGEKNIVINIKSEKNSIQESVNRSEKWMKNLNYNLSNRFNSNY